MSKKFLTDLEFSVFPVTGVVQDYAWGGTEFIPNLLGIENEEKKAYAELWIGAHERGPAKVFFDGKEINLKELIAQYPEKILGKAVAQKFGNQLPFLFKVLDVKKMLSIQVHPTKAAAECGFEEENKLGIPLTATHRNYKDQNHKPEVMVALTDFWLLHGFQSEEAIIASLENIPELKHLLAQFQNGDILKLYRYLMNLPQIEVDRILTPLAKRLRKQLGEGELQKSQADYWAALALKAKEDHLDRGIFSIYLFNLVHLKKGEAIFQDSGIPHAYLEGVNIELMANSDNVFRGGLTYKHIDVPELMKHLDTSPVTAHIIQAETRTATEKVYPTSAIDFALSCIEIKENQIHHSRQNPSAEAMIVLEGSVWVITEAQRIKRNRGEIFFAAANATYQIRTDSFAVLYKASVPV